MNLKNIKSEAIMAEFIGTLGLTFMVLVALSTPIIGVPTGVVAAVTLAVFVLAIGSISGSHLNPAITLGQYSLGRINVANTLGYIAAQISGALMALVIFGMFNDNKVFEIGGEETWEVFWAELLGAAIFGFAVAAAVVNKLEPMAASIAIGGGLLIGSIAASIASNAVINPAVAIGIGSSSWPYLIGPMLGAILGMQLYRYILPPKSEN